MVDFSMTSLEYFKSRDRHVDFCCEEDEECLDKLPSCVSITLADGSVYPSKGLVDFADPMVDTATGTVSVRAEMPNPDGLLLPGEKTKVKVLVDVLEGVMTVPSVAVRGERGRYYVYVVSADGVVTKRPVAVGSKSGRWIAVKDGLAPGEMVAVDGFEALAKAKVVKPVGVPADFDRKNAAMPSEDRK